MFRLIENRVYRLLLRTVLDYFFSLFIRKKVRWKNKSWDGLMVISFCYVMFSAALYMLS